MVLNGRANKDKAFAAWELAKLHAIETQWDQALHCLAICRQLGEAFRNEQAELLHIEALTACGRPEEAERHARQRIGKGELDAQYYHGLSNALAEAERQKGVTQPGSTRLELLNRRYKAGNLGEVKLIDPSRGFAFGNLGVPTQWLADSDRSEKISVLLCVQNAEQSVSVAVSSILGQTWRNLELVIVDDASTDSSWKLVERLSMADPRILPVRNTTSMGAYQARNRALSLATGDFIAIHDSRDWSHPQMLEAQVRALLAAAEVKLTFTGVASVSPGMKYAFRLEENTADYLHRNDRSLLIRERDLRSLGQWDGVAANADEELV